MPPSTISSINHLSPDEKWGLYSRMIPPELLRAFNIPPAYSDEQGNPLYHLIAPKGSSTAEMSVFHQHAFPDPVLYGQITDTFNGQFHIMFYNLNDPNAPRFDIDRTPDGELTQFGILQRNLPAEQAAMQAGLAPGQIRRGLRLLGEAIHTFESFVASLGHDLHFAEPLFYHNAVLFERYGFAYEKGKKLMERIQKGFEPGGDLRLKLDGSTPFRQPEAAESIRLRSWAIHDGLLGEQFTNVTMYKHVGKQSGLDTSQNCGW